MARPKPSAGPDSASAHVRLPEGTRIGCAVSTYHEEIVGVMADSARETLEAAGLAPGDLHLVRVPGTFELPLVAQRLARRPDVDAVLAFGLVLKGETEHDRHIASAVSQGLMDVGLETGKPVLFGVLTCNELSQAVRRSTRAADGGLDKGHEVARAAVEVLGALREAGAPPDSFGALEETG
jgi:6,7-dimethyl-8-ribityllumazine synthase